MKIEERKISKALTEQFRREVHANYTIKFEELIDSYNNGSRNIEEFFKKLLKLTRDLSGEDHRHLRKNLSTEEFVIFDLLTRPGPDLSPAERDEVKKVARDLLNRIKTLLVLNWRQRSQSRAQVRLAIEDPLDTTLRETHNHQWGSNLWRGWEPHSLPRAYTPDLYTRKVSTLFEHLYERYSGEGVSFYQSA